MPNVAPKESPTASGIRRPLEKIHQLLSFSWLALSMLGTAAYQYLANR